MAGFFDDIEANDVKAAAAQDKKQKLPVREKTDTPKSETKEPETEPETDESSAKPAQTSEAVESDTSSKIDIEDEDNQTPVVEAVSVFDNETAKDGFEKPHTGTDISGEFSEADDYDPKIFESVPSAPEKEEPKKEPEKEDVKVQTPQTPPSTKTTLSSNKINGYVRINGAVTVSCEITDGIDASGDITIDAQGSVSGKVDAGTNKVSVAGHVNGQIIAGDIEVSGKVRSSLKAKTISISQSAIVIGDIDGTETVIAGAVKGNISGDTVKLMPTAIIQGNVTAKSITMEDGSSISGVCKQTGSKVNPDDYFAKLGV